MVRKRIFALLLVLSMTLGLVAVSASAESGFADYSAGFPENVTIEIPVYERAFEGWNVTDNYYTRWIQQEFGDKYNVTVKYVSIGRQTEVQDYQQMLAAHTAPDIIFHYDMPQALAYYSEGVMQSLNHEEIAHYAPTYWEKMSDTVEQYGSANGENIFVFADRPMAYNFMYLLRKDWVEQVGMTVDEITSREVYIEMLKKWKEAGLGKHWERLWFNNFTHNYFFRDWPIDEKDRALYSDLSVADMTSPATERYLRDLNYLYNNDLVDREFYLRDDDNKMKAEFVAGRTGLLPLYMAANNDTIAATLANDPNAEFAALNIRGLTPAEFQPQERGYWPFGMIMGVNYETTEQERVALWMFLEWMSQPENLFTIQNGIEGETYTLDEDGIAVPVAGYDGETILSQNKNKDYWCLVVESAQYDDPDTNYKASVKNWAPAGHEDIIIDNIRFYTENAEYRTPDALFTVILETVPQYKADLNELWQELYVKCVICSEEEFDATYEDAKQTYLDAGYQEILDEKKIAIDEGNYS